MWGPEGASFTIEWRRSTFTEVDETLLDGTERNLEEVEFNGRIYSSRISTLSIGASEVTHATYSCRVNVNGELLQKSNTLFVGVQEAISSVAACGNQSTTESECADLEQRLEPVPQDSMPTPTPTPSPTPLMMGDGGSVQQALFVVVGVIAVFAIVIVALTVTIVILYRKKVARVSFKTEGESVHTCVARGRCSMTVYIPHWVVSLLIPAPLTPETQGAAAYGPFQQTAG